MPPQAQFSKQQIKKFVNYLASEELYELNDEQKEQVCQICLDPAESDKKIQLPCNPSHVFHRNCAQQWLESKAECPLCRHGFYEMITNENYNSKGNENQEKQLDEQQNEEFQEVLDGMDPNYRENFTFQIQPAFTLNYNLNRVRLDPIPGMALSSNGENASASIPSSNRRYFSHYHSNAAVSQRIREFNRRPNFSIDFRYTHNDLRNFVSHRRHISQIRYSENP